MSNSLNGKRKPAGLVFFEGQEKPRQYVIFEKAEIRGQCDMEVFTTSSLQLTYPFLDKEQAEIFLKDGRWIYRNLSAEVFTFAGGKRLAKGEETVLTDNCVIRLSNDRMLTAVFFTEFVSGCDWEIINMDDGRHTVSISDLKGGEDQAAAPQIPDLTGKRILLVEDNMINREIAGEILSMTHAAWEAAEDGQQAVEIYTASPAGTFALILMDIQMPVLDGYAAARAIRASGRADAATVPIYAMTANTFAEDVSKALSAGMNGNLPKPIDLNALLRVLSSVR